MDEDSFKKDMFPDEDASAYVRAARRYKRGTGPREMLKAVLLGLAVWGFASLAIGSYYALALAVFVSAAYWSELNTQQHTLYFDEELEEVSATLRGLRENTERLEQELDDAVARLDDLEEKAQSSENELREVSGQLQELAEHTGAEIISANFKTAKGLAATVVATEADLERAIEAAVRETGATSLSQMGLVIKTARGLLKGVAFDEKGLSVLVRSRLEVSH